MATEQTKAEVVDQKQSEEPAPRKITKSSSSFLSAFSFWFYLTCSISLLAFVLPHFLPSPSHPHPHLSLPPSLRDHYSRGRLLKLHHSPPHPPTNLFAISVGDSDAAGEAVLLLPGLAATSFSFRGVLSSLAAAGLRAASLDLPGSGFSDLPPPLPDSHQPTNPLRKIYDEIKGKGVFYAFDQLIETGHIPYQEITSSPNTAAPIPSPYGPAEMAGVIAQAIDALGLAPVHLVLHDSALAAGASLVSTNPSAVRSVTLVDSSAVLPAFPSGLFGVPVVGELVLRSRAVFKGLLRLCCARSIDGDAAEAHRLLLRGNGKRKALFEAWKALNYSFHLGEWKSSLAAKDMPVMMLWSNSWSDRWINEARRAASAIPEAKFVYHFGGRWPQEDTAEEISERIVEFVTSLPRTVKKETQESPAEHIRQSIEEANVGDYEHQHHHHDHYDLRGHGLGDGQGHAVGYVDMYGHGQAW